MELRNRYECVWDDLADSTLEYVQDYMPPHYFDHGSFLTRTWDGVSVPIHDAFREKLDL